MFLHNLGLGLLRRWYFVLAGVLLSAGACFLTWTVVPPSYQATSTAVLIPPSSLVGENGNPYLYMGGLDQVLTVLTVRLNSPEVAEPLIEGRGNAGFTVERDPTTPGPIMLITATGDSRGHAMQLLEDVVRTVPENLSVMQDQLRIPTFSRVEVMTVVQDEAPELMIKDQLRTLLAVLALCLGLTVLATAVLDRVMTAGKDRRGRRAGPAAEHLSLPVKLMRRKDALEPSSRIPRTASGGRVGDAVELQGNEQELILPTLKAKNLT